MRLIGVLFVFLMVGISGCGSNGTNLDAGADLSIVPVDAAVAPDLTVVPVVDAATPATTD